MEQRWCFMMDHDAYDYLVPWDARDEFNRLLEGEDETEFYRRFTGSRISSPWNYTFTDPVEVK